MSQRPSKTTICLAIQLLRFLDTSRYYHVLQKIPYSFFILVFGWPIAYFKCLRRAYAIAWGSLRGVSPFRGAYATLSGVGVCLRSHDSSLFFSGIITSRNKWFSIIANGCLHKAWVQARKSLCQRLRNLCRLHGIMCPGYNISCGVPVDLFSSIQKNRYSSGVKLTCLLRFTTQETTPHIIIQFKTSDAWQLSTWRCKETESNKSI